jgi:hypothetical protein
MALKWFQRVSTWLESDQQALLCSKGALLHQRKIEADRRPLVQLEVLLVHLVLGETTEETGQTGYLEEQL